MIKFRWRWSATIGLALAVAAAATVVAGAFGSVSSASTKHAANSSTLVVGGIFPFTGTKSLLSPDSLLIATVGQVKIGLTKFRGYRCKNAYAALNRARQCTQCHQRADTYLFTVMKKISHLLKFGLC